MRHLAVGAQRARLLPVVGRGQMVLQLLGAVHVLAGLSADHLLGPRVLLPLQGQHEQLQRGVVRLVGLLVVAVIVALDGFLDRVDCPSQEVCVAHPGGVLPPVGGSRGRAEVGGIAGRTSGFAAAGAVEETRVERQEEKVNSKAGA